MASGNDSPGSKGVSPEVSALQQRLEGKRATCQQIREQLSVASAERDATKNACTAGINAARTQMVRMRAELAAARCLQFAAAAASEPSNSVADEAGTTTTAVALATVDSRADAEEEHGRRQSLQLKARTLRYELGRLQHQIDALTAERPKQEAEMVRLKAELTHSCDILESTRSAARHAEVDLELSPPTAMPSSFKARSPLSPAHGAAETAVAAVPLSGGGHGCVEALAERSIRERTEVKNELLAAKSKRLTGILSAQHLLIERLERQLIKEEGALDMKGSQLLHESRRHTQLKGALRRRSDDAVAVALGVPGLATSSPPRHGRTASSPEESRASLPPGVDEGTGALKAEGAVLPPIEA